MQKAGMEFGAHTHSHFNLIKLSRSKAEEELKRSKQLMEERLGVQIMSMAYPFGIPKRHFSKEVIEIVEKVGYQYGATLVCRGVQSTDSPFSIPRIGIGSNDTVEVLEEKVSGAWDLIGVWQEKAPSWIARIISPHTFKY